MAIMLTNWHPEGLVFLFRDLDVGLKTWKIFGQHFIEDHLIETNRC